MEDNKKKKVIIGAAIGAVVLVAVIVVLLLNKDRIKASTMRLLRIVGEVTLEDGKKKKTIIDNLRLADGNALSTGSESLASVGLDDTKIISLEENSRAEFYQKGKKLELILTKGRLFFDVQAPLADNESLDIKSSTMVVGIRGTSGYVWEDPAKNIQYIFITDGHTKITGYNPETKQTEEITLGPGQRATAYMYDDGTFNTFQVDDITEDDLPIALIRELNNNPQTWERVLKATGYDETKLLKRLEEEIYDSSYISIEKIELPDAEPEPEPEPKKEETKVKPESEPEPEPEPEQAPEPVNTVASVDSAPTVQTPTSVVESEPESESEPEQSNEEPPAEQPAQQTAEQPAQQPAQQTNPTDPNSGTNTNTNNTTNNDVTYSSGTMNYLQSGSDTWTLDGLTDDSGNTFSTTFIGYSNTNTEVITMSIGKYEGEDNVVKATFIPKEATTTNKLTKYEFSYYDHDASKIGESQVYMSSEGEYYTYAFTKDQLENIGDTNMFVDVTTASGVNQSSVTVNDSDGRNIIANVNDKMINVISNNSDSDVNGGRYEISISELSGDITVSLVAGNSNVNASDYEINYWTDVNNKTTANVLDMGGVSGICYTIDAQSLSTLNTGDKLYYEFVTQ